MALMTSPLRWIPALLLAAAGCHGESATPATSQPARQLATAPATTPAAAPDAYWVYVGTYTGPNSKGIYRLRMDTATGALGAPEVAGEVASPSFLTVHPNGRFLYAVGEIDDFNGKKSGAVDAFSLDAKTGALTLLNQQPSGGLGPCHLSVDPTGRSLLVANYGSGSIEALPIGKDGKIGEAATVIQHKGAGADPSRQSEPHAHFISADLQGRYVLAADLGLDKVLVYKLDPAKSLLTPNDPPFGKVAGGSGPRHLAFHPSGRFVYVINEMALTVTAFNYDPERGVLTEIQTVSTMPGNGKAEGNSGAELQTDAAGKFLYGSNRGPDTIAAFAIDPTTGKLTPGARTPTGGKMPRNFALDPSGKWLIAANQGSNNLVVFRVDPTSGTLTPAGVTAEVSAPVCVTFVPVQR